MSQGTRILLVDDEPGMRDVCTEALRTSGHEVVSAATGQEALQAFARQSFDAAVLDLVLPDIDGLRVLDALREADPDVVVILMTGHATLEAAIEAVRRGAYDFLRKPFSALDLGRVIARGLEQRRLARQNRDLLQELDHANRDLQRQVSVVTDELTAFLDLGRKLSTTDGPLPLLHEVMRSAMHLATARSAVMLRRLPDGGFRALAAAGEAAPELGAFAGPADEPLLSRAVTAGRPVIVTELLADPETVSGAFALLSLGSALAVPLLAVTGCVGVLALFDPLEPFTDRQASLVKVLVMQAAEVVAQAGLMGPAPQADDNQFVELQDILASRQWR